MGDAWIVDGSSRKDLRELETRKRRVGCIPCWDSCNNALCVSGELGVSGTESSSGSKAERMGDVTREARKEGAGDRFAKGSSSRRSGGGELREGVKGPIENSERVGDVVPE